MSRPQTLSLDGDDWTLYWLLPHEWESRKVWEHEPSNATSRRIPAVVPGHAQEALLRSGALPDWRVGENSRLWEWTSARDWIYEKRFEVSSDHSGRVFRLRFEGIDDTAHVFLNGEKVGSHTGQFVAAEWNVTDRIRFEEPNHLLVVVEHAPDLQGQAGRTSRERRWKSRFAYGSDLSPRLVPVGLWDSVSLLITGPAWFENVSIYTNVANDRTEAAVSIVCELTGLRETPTTVFTEITQDGLPVASIADPIRVFPGDTSVVQSMTLKRVQLWWPNGCGRPALYQAALSLVDSDDRLIDRRTVEFGVRQVEAVPCDDAPPDSFPYSLSVNGKRIWLRGWNWVPLDHLYGGAAPERYERFLRLARDANVNLLRVWGGGLLEKEAFYRLCDRFGIMVWQEFPLTGSGIDSTPPQDERYLAYVQEQAEGMLPRRRNHASLVLWSGGHGLADEHGEPLGSDHRALAELRTSVEMDDPQRLWLPTSPTGPHAATDPKRPHDMHGPWKFLGLRRHAEFHNDMAPMLHSAFSCAGAADLETLESAFPDAMPTPSTEEAGWVAHGGTRWQDLEEVTAAFGMPADLAAYLRASRQLQAMGLQYAVEADRRRKWRCAGSLPWQLNEPWPKAVGTSALDYYGRPKPAYYAVKRAYRPFHVSAAFPTFAWAGESQFRADIWLHNSGQERSLLNVLATVTDLNGRELYQENLSGEAPANAAENVGDLSWRFPPGFETAFVLFLEVIDEDGETLACNAYLHSRAGDPPFAPFLQASATTLEVSPREGGISIRNTGPAVALGVSVRAETGLVGDSDFPLRPGEEREIRLSDPAAANSVTAWNAELKEVDR